MPVKAVKEYIGVPADAVENFHGAQLLFIDWQHHRMFCSPQAFAVSPDMMFQDVLDQLLPQSYSYHPDWSKVDYAAMTWLKSGQPWTPDPNKTLAEQGIGHKQTLQFTTPGLNGLNGSGY